MLPAEFFLYPSSANDRPRYFKFRTGQSHITKERTMKTLMLGLLLSALIVQSSHAQQSAAPPTETIKTAASHTPEQQEVINLSNMKWDWMADKKVDSLET